MNWWSAGAEVAVATTGGPRHAVVVEGFGDASWLAVHGLDGEHLVRNDGIVACPPDEFPDAVLRELGYERPRPNPTNGSDQ